MLVLKKEAWPRSGHKASAAQPRAGWHARRKCFARETALAKLEMTDSPWNLCRGIHRGSDQGGNVSGELGPTALVEPAVPAGEAARNSSRVTTPSPLTSRLSKRSFIFILMFFGICGP